jgi:hypothetical protein
MSYNAVAQVLADTIERYAREAESGGREYRILAPGLTSGIAESMHEILRGRALNAYLIVTPEMGTNADTGRIGAVGLTSKRIGSLIAVACPGQLASVQDSIRGSGGAIRSPAYSEEWPWIDVGADAFRFDGPVLNALVATWSDDPQTQRWLREFVSRGLCESTRAGARRSEILLDEMLGSFDISMYPEIDDIREKLLCHVGVPRPRNGVQKASDVIKSAAKLTQKVLGRCQADFDARGRARERAREGAAQGGDGQKTTMAAIDLFMDALGTSKTTDLGPLAFFGCWGKGSAMAANWLALGEGELAFLFDAQVEDKTKLDVELLADPGLVDAQGKRAVVFADGSVVAAVSYEIPAEQFEGHKWTVRVMRRQTELAESALDAAVGALELDLDVPRYLAHVSAKAAVRAVLVRDGEVAATVRLDIHVCGQARPALVVAMPQFIVLDAVVPDEEDDAAAEKITVAEPTYLYLFCHNDDRVSVEDEDGAMVAVEMRNVRGIYRTSEPVDVYAQPGGMATRYCLCGDHCAALTLEGGVDGRGEFTIEDELRAALVARDKRRVATLVDLFAGRSAELYPRLGPVDGAAANLVGVAELMDKADGWKPILANLRALPAFEAVQPREYTVELGPMGSAPPVVAGLPREAAMCLSAYADVRNRVLAGVREAVRDVPASVVHPTYATHPIFVGGREAQLSALLSEYLNAYDGLITYVEGALGALEWAQAFVLLHVDCMVHWGDDGEAARYVVYGPWHPMIVAKRFMVQAALYARGDRMLHRDNGDKMTGLAVLLSRVEGFSWAVGLSSRERHLVPLRVAASGDPAWHVGADIAGLVQPNDAEPEFAQMRRVLERNWGVQIAGDSGNLEGLAATALRGYCRAYPSRRAVGMSVSRGYSPAGVVLAVDKCVHSEDGPTKLGRRIQGGVRLFLREAMPANCDARWEEPPLHVFEYGSDESCFGVEHPDIHLLPPISDIGFRREDAVPGQSRGSGHMAVFSQGVSWLTEGAAAVPLSVSATIDAPVASDGELGSRFASVAAHLARAHGAPQVAIVSTNLPHTLATPWVVVPGFMADPAAMVKYVSDGAAVAGQDRALWDFRFDILGGKASYFVLSRVPRGFEVAVNGFFGNQSVAAEFVIELGRMGIAIGSEALRSGRHAVGALGVVGAARLMAKANTCASIGSATGPLSIRLLLAVDSFASFFGNVDEESGKRCDLLCINLSLSGDEDCEQLRVSAVGVEAKYISGTFDLDRAAAAMAQAHASEREFANLVRLSREPGGVPEQLALLKMLVFGLRLVAGQSMSVGSELMRAEMRVHNAVLGGRYEYCRADTAAVVVSTEAELPGVAEHRAVDGGLWVRLTRKSWPGVVDGEHLDAVRAAVQGIFAGSDFQRRQPIEIPVGVPGGDEKGETSDDTGNDSEAAESADVVSGDIVENDDDVVAPVTSAALARVFVGVDDARSPVYFDPQLSINPLENLNMMVTGSSGTGKTQFLKYLIACLCGQGKKVLVLDMKNDFASDVVFCNAAGLTRHSVAFTGLPLNPLIPYPIPHPDTGEMFVQCAQYISGVAAVLKRVYGLGPQQQVAVKNAITKAFEANGIKTSGNVAYDDTLPFPDLGDVGEILASTNPAAYNRLDPLFTLDLFHDEFRTRSFHGLTQAAAVLDVSQIANEQIRNAIAHLVVLASHAYFNAQPHSGAIRQFLVFDEAHRVLSSDYIAALVRECRAYGVGTILSSQYPSDFPVDIAASMATKVLHGNGRDVERVKDIVKILGCEGRDASIAGLDRFQAMFDNKHCPAKVMRTMNHPLYLVWRRVCEHGSATLDFLEQTPGLDTKKLSMANLVVELERMGLVERRDGAVCATGVGLE